MLYRNLFSLAIPVAPYITRRRTTLCSRSLPPTLFSWFTLLLRLRGKYNHSGHRHGAGIRWARLQATPQRMPGPAEPEPGAWPGKTGFRVGGSGRQLWWGHLYTPWNTDLAINDTEKQALYEEIQELLQDSPIPIRHFTSLHSNGGVHFCKQLSLREATISTAGEMVFYCDLAGFARPIGSLDEQSFAALLSRWLQLSEICRSSASGASPWGTCTKGSIRVQFATFLFLRLDNPHLYYSPFLQITS